MDTEKRMDETSEGSDKPDAMHGEPKSDEEHLIYNPYRTLDLHVYHVTVRGRYNGLRLAKINLEAKDPDVDARDF